MMPVLYQLGAVNMNARVSIFGVSLSVADVQEALCRVLLRPNGIPCDCQSLLAIPERAMENYVVDLIASAIEPYLGGASCSSNLVDIVAGALSVGVSTTGVTVDFDAANLAKSALCNMAKFGVKQSGELSRYAGTLVSALRNNCVQLVQQSGGQVTTNPRYGQPPPVVNTNPPPAALPPIQTTPQQQPVRRRGGWLNIPTAPKTGENAGQTSTPVVVAPGSSGAAPIQQVSTKRRIAPALVFSGVAVGVAAVILFKRR